MATQIAPRHRPGLTLLELLGCLAGVGGGLWIGTTYLGIDLPRAVYQVADRTDLLEQIPVAWRPANPDCPNGDCPTPEEVQAKKDEVLRQELASLHFEVAVLHGEAGPNVGLVENATRLAARDRSAAYWKRLSEIAQEIKTLEQRIDRTQFSGNSPQVLSIKQHLLEYGTRALGSLNIEGVDPKVQGAGVRLSEWYEQGAKLLSHAQEMNRQASSGDPSIASSRGWSQAEQHHKKQTELVRRWITEAQVYMKGEYSLELPPLNI